MMCEKRTLLHRQNPATVQIGLHLEQSDQCICPSLIKSNVRFDSLRPSQQSFSYVGTGFPGLNQSSTKQGLINVLEFIINIYIFEAIL